MICRWFAAVLGIDWSSPWTGPADESRGGGPALDRHLDRADAIRAHVRQQDTGAGAPPRRISNCMTIAPPAVSPFDPFAEARHNDWPAT